MATKDDKAWEIVQNKFQNDIDNSIDHIKTYDYLCKDKFDENLELNMNQVVKENLGIPNDDMVSKLYNLGAEMRPEFLFQAVVYDDIEGYDNHTLGCYQCIILLHFRDEYSIILAYLDPEDGGPNLPAVEEDYKRQASYVESSMDADEVYNVFAYYGCWTGILVVETGHSYFTYGTFAYDYYMRFLPQLTEKMNVMLWAQGGFPCLRPPTTKKYLESRKLELLSENDSKDNGGLSGSLKKEEKKKNSGLSGDTQRYEEL